MNDLERVYKNDRVVPVRIRERHWGPLTERGLPLAKDGLLRLVRQSDGVYGLEFVSSEREAA